MSRRRIFTKELFKLIRDFHIILMVLKLNTASINFNTYYLRKKFRLSLYGFISSPDSSFRSKRRAAMVNQDSRGKVITVRISARSYSLILIQNVY